MSRQLVPERDSKLHDELVRQQHNEHLRKQFALKANMVGQWIEKRLDAESALFGQKGSLEDHLNKLRSIEKEVSEFSPNIKELDNYNQAMQEAMVFDNPHTPYTMEVLNITGASIYVEVSCSSRLPSFLAHTTDEFSVMTG